MTEKYVWVFRRLFIFVDGKQEPKNDRNDDKEDDEFFGHSHKPSGQPEESLIYSVIRPGKFAENCPILCLFLGSSDNIRGP